MKTLKKTAAIAALAFVLAACLALVGCGSYSLEEGTYTGTYKCHYSHDYTITTTGPFGGTNGYHGEHWGCIVTFEVDSNNTVWNVSMVAPKADADSDNEEYIAYVKPGLSDVFLTQFSAWTIAEIMAVKITVNDKGFPIEMNSDSKKITVPAGQMPQCAMIVLAMQSAIETGTKAA